jgi:hypothetical protein
MMATLLRDLCAGNPDVKAWLREHGLEPRLVSMNEGLRPVIDGDRMTVHLYLLNELGQKYIDPETGGVAHEVRTVTISRPPPDLVTTTGRHFPATEPLPV